MSENSIETSVVPPVNGTDDGEAVHGAWVAVMVHTNCERRVADRLEQLSFECYVPVQEEIHRWSDRMKKVQRLVIPSIVFVRSKEARFSELRRQSQVRCLLTNPGETRPAIIPDVQIERLRFMLGQSDVPVELSNNMHQMEMGSKVIVMRGIFRGLEGTVSYMSDGSVHVGVLLQGLGYAHVEINKKDIQEI